MSIEHNLAPPPPFRCSLQPSAGEKRFLWEHEFNNHAMFAVKRTNITLEKEISEQRSVEATLVVGAACFEAPSPLNNILMFMPKLLNNTPSSSTAAGLAPPPVFPVRDAALDIMSHLIVDCPERVTRDYSLPYTINMPIPTPSVHIGDVGYIHKRTGEFVRLVNPFDMNHTAVGAMQRARGLDQDILRVCRHPEQAWSSSLSSSGDVAKLSLPSYTNTRIIANGIISTHAHVKSVLEMRTWLAWHTPLIMAVYGPAHGITRSDLLMVTSTVTARRWLMLSHYGVPGSSEATVSVSGEGHDRRLNVELPAGVRSMTVNSPPPPPTGDAPGYTLSVSGLMFRRDAILPETLDIGGRFIDLAAIEATTAFFRAREEAMFVEEEKQLDELLHDIDEYRVQLPSTDELKRQVGMVRDMVEAARQDLFGRYDIMREIREIESGWGRYVEELKAANEPTSEASFSSSALSGFTSASSDGSEASSNSSRKSLSRLFKGSWNRLLRRKTRTAGLPRENLN